MSKIKFLDNDYSLQELSFLLDFNDKKAIDLHSNILFELEDTTMQIFQLKEDVGDEIINEMINRLN